MRKIVWIMAATMVGSGLIAAPAQAQVRLGVGPDGPSVEIGRDRGRVIEHRRYIERRRYDDDDLVTGSIGRCKTVTIREEDDSGDIVTRRVRRCR